MVGIVSIGTFFKIYFDFRACVIRMGSERWASFGAGMESLGVERSSPIDESLPDRSTGTGFSAHRTIVHSPGGRSRSVARHGANALASAQFNVVFLRPMVCTTLDFHSRADQLEFVLSTFDSGVYLRSCDDLPYGVSPNLAWGDPWSCVHVMLGVKGNMNTYTLMMTTSVDDNQLFWFLKNFISII